MLIDLDVLLDVDFLFDDPCPEGKLFPITLLSAKYRGKCILSQMHIGNVMTLQRRVFNRLCDADDPRVVGWRY